MVMLKGFNHCQFVSQLPPLTLTWKNYGQIFCFNISGIHRGEDSYYGVARPVSTNISVEHSTIIFSIKVTSILKTKAAYSSEMYDLRFSQQWL
jgi:hypothetical protein